MSELPIFLVLSRFFKFIQVVRHFSQLVYGNLYFLFCLFHTAVVNLDNSVVDLETLQALYENVSNRRFSV